MSPADLVSEPTGHRLENVWLQAGSWKALCECGHRSSGIDRVAANDNHAIHRAEQRGTSAVEQ